MAALAATRYPAAMDFDHLLVRFFGTADIDTLSPDRLGEGVELVRLQLGLERDSGRRSRSGASCTCWGWRPIWTPPSRTKTIATPPATSWTRPTA